MEVYSALEQVCTAMAHDYLSYTLYPCDFNENSVSQYTARNMATECMHCRQLMLSRILLGILSIFFIFNQKKIPPVLYDIVLLNN